MGIFIIHFTTAILLLLVVILFFYFALPNLLFRRTPRVNRRIFTFDDGPTPGVTERVLDILDRTGERGIFFVLAQKACEHQELIREIESRGHEIGFHGEKHVFHTKLSPTAEWRSLARGLKNLRAIAHVRYLRPPHGAWTLTTAIFLLTHGLKALHWTKLVQDWENPTTETLIKRLRAIDGPNVVFVLHDGTEEDAHPDAAAHMLIALDEFLKPLPPKP